ncbi:hypothetical protein PTKIN_Ptkin14bG0227100 [Pterospermum kingtungense]
MASVLYQQQPEILKLVPSDDYPLTVPHYITRNVANDVPAWGRNKHHPLNSSEELKHRLNSSDERWKPTSSEERKLVDRLCLRRLGISDLIRPRKRFLAPTMESNSNPKVFFDITIGGQREGRIVMELYTDVAPLTADNFRALCTGEKGIGRNGKSLHYKGSTFHKVIPDFICKGGGDIGDYSIYGFNQENHFNKKKHTGCGAVSMVNGRPRFFIRLVQNNIGLDGRHVIFGQVVLGMKVLDAIEKVGSSSGKTSKPVVIVDCGQCYY